MRTIKMIVHFIKVFVLISLLAMSGTAVHAEVIAAEIICPEGRIIYVNDDADGANSGESWSDAYNKLQYAISAAIPGDEIWVAEGVYTPSPYSPPGPSRDYSFQTKNCVKMYGGFPEGGGTWEMRNSDPTTNNTILSGDLLGNDEQNFANYYENSYHVVSGSFDDRGAILDGFSIYGGNARGCPNENGGGFTGYRTNALLLNIAFIGNYANNNGGGMHLTNHSSPSLTNVIFSDNYARFYGGGMNNNDYSNPILKEVIFSDNSAEISGGGMFNWETSTPTLENVTFSGNLATSDGGGMFNSYSNPVLSNVTFSNNTAIGRGGGLYNFHSHPSMTNLTFNGNYAHFNGGGMLNEYSSPALTNVDFISNSAIHGGGLENGIFSYPTLTNVTFSGNSATGVGGGMYIWGTGTGSLNIVPSLDKVTFTKNTARQGGGLYIGGNGESRLTNVTFTGNLATSDGGGMSVTTTDISSMTNVNFIGNSAISRGGGMFNLTVDSLTMTNATFSGNSAEYGGAMYNSDSVLSIVNSIFWGNSSPNSNPIDDETQSSIIRYSDIEGGWVGVGNLDANPLFIRDPNPGPDGIWGNEDDDYGDLNLKSGSPAINTGNNSVDPDPYRSPPDSMADILFDLGGNPRIVYGTIDMGAYEFLNDIDGDGIPDEIDNAPTHFNPDQSDIDGDGIGDVADPCPNDDQNLCDADGSGSGYIDPETGGTVTTPDGSTTVEIPPGSLPEGTSISITDTDGGNSGFELTTNLGNALGIFSFDLQPPLSFDEPIKIVFSWKDDDNDGWVDGTNAKEENLLITKDNIAMTDKCKNEPNDGNLPDCDTDANTFSIQVTSWSEFALAFPKDTDDDGIVDNFDGIVDNCQTVFNDDQADSNNDGQGDACDPDVLSISAPIEPVNINDQPIIVSGTFIDADDHNSHSAEWDWGDKTQSSGTVNQIGNSVTGSHIYSEPGVYTLTLTVTDSYPAFNNETYEFIVVYDSDSGFVTGGGWIDSPEGAYTADPSLVGKATFGFVSKYKKGAEVPTGNTEFQFQAGDLNFHSSSYDWLVVTGSDYAKFKGIGTINGEGVYKFQIWAGDNEPDTFRIKIWTEDEFDVETVVYDNGDDQTIQAGNIVIHTKK